MNLTVGRDLSSFDDINSSSTPGQHTEDLAITLSVILTPFKYTYCAGAYSQPQHLLHFRLWGAILCIGGCLAASLDSIHKISVAHTLLFPTNCDSPKCLQTLPNTPGGSKGEVQNCLAGNHWSRLRSMCIPTCVYIHRSMTN